MTKEFVNYEQALALRELGFDEPCFTSYDDEGDLRNPFDYENSEYNHNRSYIGDTKNFVHNSELTIENFVGAKHLYKQFIAAPLYQQAFKFFREKYNYNHSIVFTKHPFGTDEYQYMILLDDDEYVEINFKTYEEAELECLKKLIDIVKNKQP